MKIERPKGTVETTVQLAERARIQHNPVLVYLARLESARSRETMVGALRRILVSLGLDKETKPEDFPWAKMKYAEATAAKAALMANCKPGSVNQSLCAMRGVLHEAYRLDLIDGETWWRIKDVGGIRVERLPAGRYVPYDELEKLFLACDRSSEKGTRDAAVLATLRTTGVRRAELCGIRYPKDVRLKDGDVTVIGKRNKERLLNFGNALTDVTQWIEVRGRSPGALFWGQDIYGKWTRDGLTESGVYEILVKLAKKAGIAPVRPHDLRRTCASDLLDAGVDLVTVQKILGHDDPKTTSRYDRRADAARKLAVAKLEIPR